MQLEIGMCFQIKTKTFEDTFGEVIWKIVELGLPARPDGTEGIRCELISGTGDDAHPGYQLTDSRKAIEGHFTKGLARLVPQAQVAAVINAKGKRPNGGIYTEID